LNNQGPATELTVAVNTLRPVFYKAVALSVLVSFLMLTPTIYMLQVYDRVLNSRSSVTLLMLTLMVVLAYVVMALVDQLRGALMRAAGVQLEVLLSRRVYGAMLDGLLRRKLPPNLQPLSDFRAVREFMPSPAFLAIMEAPVALLALALSFVISPVLGAATLVGGVLQLGIALLNERATQEPLGRARLASSQATQFAEASIRNAHVVQAMGMQDQLYSRWQALQNNLLIQQAQASDGAGLWLNLSKSLQLVMGSLLLGLGAWLHMNNALNGGAAMMIIGSLVGGRVLAPLSQLVSQWGTVVQVRQSWQQLSMLLASFPEREAAMALPAPDGRLSVETVVAGPPGMLGQAAAVIKGVHFELTPGEVLAVVGPSASGKTSLARLLVGLWPTLSGKVRLSGADVHAWNKTELGPYVGYLPQGVELLEGTVAENIARFGQSSPSKVEAAARLVGLHDLIASLPQGYNTYVGRDGAIFSGGQRQRVGLARALYDRPVFVVLDEPNSSLDEAGDAALSAAIASLKAEGTTFVIMTHRTSVLGVVDKLLILREGMQQAFGPRDEVLAALQSAQKR
jgi:ATP-binding cassette subfamily C exporter for protease/lipase